VRLFSSPWGTEVQNEVRVPGSIRPLIPRILSELVALEVTEGATDMMHCG